MALKIGECVVRGELIHQRPRLTQVFLQLRDRNTTIRADLFGDPGPDLIGKHIVFEANAREYDFARRKSAKGLELALEQIGAVGVMTANETVRVFEGSVENFLRRSKLGEPSPTEWKRLLRLEWFSQNGHVSLQLVDPELKEVVDESDEDRDRPLPPPDPPPFDPNDPPEAGMPDVIQIEWKEDGTFQAARPDADTDDQQEEDEEVFLPDLDQALGAYRQDRRQTYQDEDEDEGDPLADVKLLEEIFASGRQGMKLGEILCRMPRAADLSEERAESLLRLLIGRLAMYHVAYHICEHVNAREAYRILVEELAGVGDIHPELTGTGWITHFDTGDHCPKCLEDLDARLGEV